MPRLRFHNLNNGTNNRIGSEDITSTALLIFCAVVVLIPVTGIATFTWYMPFAFFSGVAVMFCGTSCNPVGWSWLAPLSQPGP